MDEAQTNAPALLLLSESYHHADMYYAIRFLFSDPVLYLRQGGRETLVCGGFEREEAARHSRIQEVLSFDQRGYGELLQQFPKAQRYLAMAELTRRLLEERGIQEVTVTSEAPVHVVDHLRSAGITVTCDPAALTEARKIKRTDEVAAIESAQRATERAMRRAIDLIANSEPRDGILTLDGRPLTAEQLRTAIDTSFLADDCLAEGTITAGGTDAAAPHNHGAGPLRANQAIVLDIFPRHKQHRYFADMTRTVSKGDPGAEMRRRYDATLRAQEVALELIRPGANGREVYEAACRVYEDAGYATSLRDGSYPETGFIHSLGHGVGLDIHEGPSMGRQDDALEEGHVVSVEPGLYDPAIGGVRIEDLVVVTGNGCRNLTEFEKRLVV